LTGALPICCPTLFLDWTIMATERERATAEFRRIMIWIIGIGLVMAVGAIVYLALTGELYLHLVVATLGGVFFSVLLGCGLFALSFFSDKSGHDQSVNDATKTEREQH
jgi:uncharacterized membrane protein YgdD (TMEM256/DUF423 family)